MHDIRKKWDIKRDSLVFVAAGRLTHQKGFDLLIEAASKVKNPSKPFSILIAGAGKDYSQNIVFVPSGMFTNFTLFSKVKT